MEVLERIGSKVLKLTNVDMKYINVWRYMKNTLQFWMRLCEKGSAKLSQLTEFRSIDQLVRRYHEGVNVENVRD